MILKQRTIAEPIKTVGIGLHSGKKANLFLKPAPINYGIAFVRIDLENQEPIPAHALNITDTRFASVLVIGPQRISTVEHLLSAC